jgi:putative endonuclease
MKDYYVYILTNRSGTLYVGVTSDLMRRVQEHRDGKAGSFTQKYGINRLVYFESGNDVEGAISREKQLKGWTRQRKIELIAAENPKWLDLSAGWYDEREPSDSPAGQMLHSVQDDRFKEDRRGLIKTAGHSGPREPDDVPDGQILRSAQNDSSKGQRQDLSSGVGFNGSREPGDVPGGQILRSAQNDNLKPLGHGLDPIKELTYV